MKDISDAFASRLASGAATNCLCWIITSPEGDRIGLTDHDKPLVVDAVACAPDVGIGNVSFSSTDGLAPGAAEFSGVISIDALTEEDLASGVWNGARIDVWRVNWRAPEDKFHVWSGRLSEVRRENGAFSAELVSLKADLERKIGRVFARSCDADLGDSRCQVDLDVAAYRFEGAISEIVSDTQLVIAGAETFDDNWFANGRMERSSGSDARILSNTGQVVVLDTPSGASVGETVTLIVGCDKHFQTCRAKFANADNFRGFPHLPGIDAILSGPAADGNDGGRR